MTGEPHQPQETVMKGIPAAPGIAVGPAYLYARTVPQVQMRHITAEDVPAELERLRTAMSRAEKELQKIHAFAAQKLGTEGAGIFEAQIMILNDAVLIGAIEHRVREELRNAEYVVWDEITRYRRMMLAAPDEYMHERAQDVEDVMHRIVRNIQDQKLYSRLDGESVIISENLTPADTVIFSRNQILGYATDLGGTTSHAAILSRSLKIPAVVGLRNATRQVRSGDRVAIDGYSGLLVINPTEETLQHLQRKAARFREFDERLTEIAGLMAETVDHHHIELSANIEFPEEVEYARIQGAAGIGLYRTESLIIGRAQYPPEEEQAEVYTLVAEGMYPHPVIFRTFDVGGDKVMPDAQAEENPFLGWRGIRILLDQPEILQAQLRALLRASTRRNVRIMFPMVSTVTEVRRARAQLETAKSDLRARGIRFDEEMKIGVMIEVPAAALMTDAIAAEVDFLSIGTNDLIQYLMAVDRDNAAVADLYQQFNPAVIRTIKMIIDAGHRRNVWVGMCGEMAGDPLATILLVGLGLDEFSTVPTNLPEIKKIIRSVRVRDARRVAERALALETDEEVRTFLARTTRKLIPELPIDMD
ncbi:MAG: phosphoenolpyruvate--protein phosphotransferase [Bacteroidetes bacterium]|nr:phosphoenolpyruvate--protein phosphotransferase [Bacteroidota bacterium]